MSDKKPNLILLQEYLSPSIQTLTPKPEPPPKVPKEDLPPPTDELPAILEAILLAADKPLKIEALNYILNSPGKAPVLKALRILQQSWKEEKRGIRVEEVAHGWQIRTAAEYGHWVQRSKDGKPKKLSKASLEVLSIIAYRQPVTRAEVDQIRGVDSSAVISKLIQAQLVTNVGRREDDPGKPLLLGTTDGFLSLFNLRDLLALPTLKEVKELEAGFGGTPRSSFDEELE